MQSGIQRIYKSESTRYTTVPNWVVRDPSYSPNTFRLLAYLLSHENGYELTYAQIERETTLGRYAINEASKFLITSGWLEWKQDKGPDGKYLAKTWIIKNPVANDSTADDSGVESFRSGTTNGHIETKYIKKPNTKRSQISEKDERELFAEFWKEYPRKADKGAALKAFRSALRRATFEDILAGTISYRNDPNREDAFTKYPATWLNADSWGNGPLPPRKLNNLNEQERIRKEWLNATE